MTMKQAVTVMHQPAPMHAADDEDLQLLTELTNLRQLGKYV